MDFVLVTPLVLLLGLAALQAGLLLAARSTLTTAAADGARAGALAGSDASVGAGRATEAVRAAIPGAVVRHVRAASGVRDGVPVMQVRIDVSVPLLAPLGTVDMEVEGHALLER